MSRILTIMIALLAIATLVAPAFAEDRLSLSGEMRVRGWYKESPTDNSLTDTYADQRLRVGGKISVAEGVSVTFRTDITESTWGTTGGGNGYGSGRSGANQQWDRAHLDIAKDGWALRAGQQLIVLGNTGYDSQDNGLKFSLMGPATITLFYMMDDNNGTGFGSQSDAFSYGVAASHKTDSYNGSLFVVNYTDGMDEDVYMVGGTFGTTLNVIDLYVEAEYFTGDATATVDAIGTQLLVDASMAATDMVKVGGQIMYAVAADSNGTESQYQILGNGFNGWDPLFDVGTGLSNEQIGVGRPFDLFGNGSGLMAGRLYTNVKASDALALGASFTYATPDDDNSVAQNVDSAIAFAGGLVYNVMANTHLDVQVEYIDSDANADAIIQSGVGLFVNF